MRRIAAPNDNGNSGSSIATPSRLHKLKLEEFVWATVAYIWPTATLLNPGYHPRHTLYPLRHQQRRP
jgi:hypothetical protein